MNQNPCSDAALNLFIRDVDKPVETTATISVTVGGKIKRIIVEAREIVTPENKRSP